ncbi:MAG: tRNA-binding protein [Firmicutes bacterium]|nr:tRNA-binding protein [Bacillota bacterium]MCL5012560.1 tRNA-binding protein [Bacillota bacterium]
MGLYVGTIRRAVPNPKAKKPAYFITVDFGPFGMKDSSAQLTERYQPDDLIGRQIVAVLNLPPKKVAGVRSEVLILGAMMSETDVVLLSVESPVPNGTAIG